MASAWFVDVPAQLRRGVKLFWWKTTLGLLLLLVGCRDTEPPPERSRRRLDAAPPAVPTEGPPDALAGPPPECEVGRDACVGDDLVWCLPGGKLGPAFETCADGCKAGRCADPCETQGVELIYVVDENDQLMSFDPRKLPDDPFALVGTLRCEAATTPYSMAVDRRGIAWVLYHSGNLYRVSILDAHCSAAVYTEPEDALYGMGFVAAGARAASEKLVVATGTHLTQLDLKQTPPRRNRIGAIEAGQRPEPGPELTGTGDGKLFAYFPDPGRKFVRQLDPATGKAQGKRIAVAGGAGEVRAWAFAHWGGVFYVFETTDDVGSSVYAIPRKGGKTTRVRDHLSTHIVGAGVSTCAPALEAPLGAP